MCGRFVISMPPETMRELFVFFEQPNFPPRYNIAPTQPVPIIRQEAGKRHFVLVRWGLIPSWAKEEPQSVLINARAETIAEKPSFRGAFRHHRALIPADGYYEWQTTKPGIKQPYFIRRQDCKPFAMAAIWDNWMPSNGSEMESTALITTQANESLISIHHRMPVILDPAQWDLWLDPTTPVKELQALLIPAPEALLEAVPISTRVNKVANDGASLLERVAPMEVQPEPAAKKSKTTRDNRQIDLF